MTCCVQVGLFFFLLKKSLKKCDPDLFNGLILTRYETGENSASLGQFLKSQLGSRLLASVQFGPNTTLFYSYS